MLSEEQIKNIELKATEIRKDIINMLVEAGSGHSAGPLGMADIFATLYFSDILSWDPVEPWKEDRDRVLLSNGHICPVWYATLGHTGAFSHKELLSLRKLGTRLQGHPHYRSLPGIENTAGPLGQGLSVAIGMGLSFKMDKLKRKIYCLMSDGELQEGQNWEALMFASKYNLNNIVAVIDRNNIQIDGNTEDVMPLEPLNEKLKAFGWAVLEIDGHNIEEIYNAFNEAHALAEKPTIIIAHTIPGKGVDFMEGDYRWHGIPPKPSEAAIALKELRTLWGKIEPD